jgi:hemerythrin superfamily protein
LTRCGDVQSFPLESEGTPVNVIHVVEAEHRSIERLFDRFERAARAGDPRQEAELARELVREISQHAAVEEQVLYPALQRAGLTAERLDALEDHHATKLALSELQALTPAAERFVAKVHVVAKALRLHMQEEESAVLPRLGEEVGPDELERMGGEFEALRRAAPTRPHPASPDVPPANLFVNAAASLVDRLRDALEDGRRRLRTTAQLLVVSAVRAGRDAAGRTRQNGKLLVAQAREGGERALERTRVLGVEVLQGAADTGQGVAKKIEQRSALAARELSQRAKAPRARKAAGKRRNKAAAARR